jgi:molybdenum cofactor synthesis domain-containing protein
MTTTGKVISLNISQKKGTIKQPVPSIQIGNEGITGDAHAGLWHRQVSLLAVESIEKFNLQAGRTIRYGEFAENITTQGIELLKTHPLDRLIVGETELEITQIGKECHGTSCNIYREVGNCVMPKEGVFARVLKTGSIRTGDVIIYQPKCFNVLIITLSDRASRGEYEDLSGPAAQKLLADFFTNLGYEFSIEKIVIPDDADKLKELVLSAAGNLTDLVITTGGTGIGKRDITPETIIPMLDKEISGIMEMIRYKYGSQKPNGLLSRAIAGVIDNTLVYTLPGSVKAVGEYLTEIIPTLRHSFFMLHNLDTH